MKNLRKLCATFVLTLVLALSAVAGDMSTPGATAPQTKQQSSVTGDISFPRATTIGEIPTPGVVVLDPVTDATLSLLQSLMSLF